MKFNKLRIAALSRDPSFLLRTVLWILLPGLALAFGISMWRGSAAAAGTQRDRVIPEKPEVNISSRSECVRLLEITRHNQRRMEVRLRAGNPDKKAAPVDFDSVSLMGGEMYLRPEEQQLFINYKVKMEYFHKMQGPDIEPFAKAAAANPVSGFICSMQGDLLRASGEYESALAAYERGSADPETGADCSRRALSLCVLREWTDRLHRLYGQPGWRQTVLEPGSRYEDAYAVVVAARDWSGVLRVLWRLVWQRITSPLWITMAAMAGALWFLVIHVGAAVPVRLWWRGILGFGCGLLAIPLTHLLYTIQEVWFGAQEHSGVLNDIFYCISSIGLREELSKIILFLPLLIILRKAPAAHVLAVSASVGLGFASLENVDYFNTDQASAVWGRFLMANFLHFALTGLTGLALWQAVRNSAWLTHFVWVLVGAVVFHGLWDFSPADVRITGDYRYFVLAGFAGLSLYFFRELSGYTQPQSGVPSAVFIYLAGGSLMLSLLMSATAWEIGFRQALIATFSPVLGTFIIGAAMFYELRKA